MVSLRSMSEWSLGERVAKLVVSTGVPDRSSTVDLVGEPEDEGVIDVRAGLQAQLDLARAGLDPESAIAAAEEADKSEVELESSAGVVALERAPALTIAVEVEPPSSPSRWRWFICYTLLKLAARIYPFKLELYRTRRSWE